jgi:hypothetical protein
MTFSLAKERSWKQQRKEAKENYLIQEEGEFLERRDLSGGMWDSALSEVE